MISIRHMLVAGALCTAAAGAQQPLPQIPSGPGQYIAAERHDGGGFAGEAAIARGLTAHLTGHLLPDAVWTDADGVWVASAPGIHQSVHPIGTAILDVAVLHAGQAAPARDALALVDGDGLRVWSFDPVLAAPELSPPVTAFAGSSRVATHPADPTVLFAVHPNGAWLVAAARTGMTLGAPSSFPGPGGPILDIVACDHDGDGLAEIAVLTAGRLTIFDRSGAEVSDTPSGTPSSVEAITRVRMAGAGDWIAWLRDGAGAGQQELRVLRGSVAVGTVPLGATDYVAISAGDLTIDGREDLCLVGPDHHAVAILYNGYPFLPDGFWHDVATGVAVAVTAPDPSRVTAAAAPIVADFDGDGDGDMLAVIEASASEGRHRVLLRPSVIANDAAVGLAGNLVWDEETVPGVATVSFDYAVVPSAANATQLLVWDVGQPIGQDPLIAVRPVFASLHPALHGRVQVDLDVQVLDSGYYAFALRPVAVDGAGQVVASGPPLLGGMWRRPDLSTTFASSLAQSLLIDPNDTRIGGVSPARPLPPLPPGSGPPSSEPPADPPTGGG